MNYFGSCQYNYFFDKFLSNLFFILPNEMKCWLEFGVVISFLINKLVFCVEQDLLVDEVS